jgi:hypothetical protein
MREVSVTRAQHSLIALPLLGRSDPPGESCSSCRHGSAALTHLLATQIRSMPEGRQTDARPQYTPARERSVSNNPDLGR